MLGQVCKLTTVHPRPHTQHTAGASCPTPPFPAVHWACMWATTSMCIVTMHICIVTMHIWQICMLPCLGNPEHVAPSTSISINTTAPRTVSRERCEVCSQWQQDPGMNVLVPSKGKSQLQISQHSLVQHWYCCNGSIMAEARDLHSSALAACMMIAPNGTNATSCQWHGAIGRQSPSQRPTSTKSWPSGQTSPSCALFMLNWGPCQPLSTQAMTTSQSTGSAAPWFFNRLRIALTRY